VAKLRATPVGTVLAPTASSPMRRCPYRVHVPVGAAAAAPTKPLDTDVTRLHGLRPRKLRATGQRRIMCRMVYLMALTNINTGKNNITHDEQPKNNTEPKVMIPKNDVSNKTTSF